MHRRSLKTALAVLLGVGLVSPALGATSPAAAACVLEPTLRVSTVNQGVGSYPKLVQGKDTLVRLFITMPSCATSRDTIELVGGSVTVAGGVGGTGSLVPPIGETAPTLGLSISNDSPSNPLFLVPGSALTSAAGTAFTATFTATVQYRARPAGQSTFGATQSVALPRPGQPAITRDVNSRSNALRVLVVPMGDGTRGYATDFPGAASAATQRAMENLARMLPVPTGTSDLASTGPAGVRYRVLPTLLDLNQLGLMRPVNGTNRFCGSGANFGTLQQQLSAFRQSWNAANPTAAADRVVGVVWETVAIGTDAGTGCDEGLASINGTEAWFRASSTYNGAVATMEVLHTLGAAVGDHAEVDYHSRNREADRTDPERAYNVLLRRYLADDRSVMNLSGAGWQETNTVLEPNDWSHALCRLTPGANLGCLGTTVGGPAAAGSSFVITGTVTVGSGTPAADIHSWFEPGGVEQTAVPDQSTYELVQRTAAGAELRRTRVPYSSDATHHVGHEHHHATNTESIDATVSTHGLADVFELVRNGTVVYRRQRNSQPTLVVVPDPSVENVRNWSQDPARQDVAPALSPDGALMAWSDGTNIFVRDVARQRPISAPLAGTDPAWYPADGVRRLGYVRDGDVHMTTVTVAGSGAATFGLSVPVYVAAQQVIPNAAASHPTWAPVAVGRADRVAIQVAGDLWEVDVDLVPGNEPICRAEATALDGCRPLVRTAGIDEQHPSWSERGVAYDAASPGAASTIRIVDPQTRQVTDTGVAGTDPTWAGTRLVFSRPATGTQPPGLFSVPAASPVGVAPARLTASADTAAAATAAGDVIGFVRRGADDEVHLADVGNGSGATVIATDADGAGQLEADLFVVCGDETVPVVVDILPDSVDGNVARFHVSYDAGPACDGSFLRVRVTDGWLTATEDIAGPFGADDPPVPSIAAPVAGVYTEWDSIPVAGSANDDTDPLTYSWTLVHPNGNTQSLGSGETLPDVAPPPSGWPVGDYRVRLVVTDGAHTTSTEVVITVVDDDDNDGMTNTEESCLGRGATTDPTNAFADTDRDGLVNVDDPAPCTSGSTMTVDFEPNTLNLTSTGTPVTTYLRSTNVAMSTVDRSTVAIVRIGGYPVRFPATAWSVSGGVGTAQFSRPDLVAFLQQRGLVGTYVPIVISATSTDGTRVQGLDGSAPVTQQ